MSSRITRADLQAALPDVTSTLHLPGLHRSVDVCRDRWGIPHIRAEDEHDAFFAQGFVTAQDRLWHMDYDRQRALGRWAEWAGPAALPEDRLMRTFRLERAARADLAVSSPAAQAMLAVVHRWRERVHHDHAHPPHRIHHPGHDARALGSLALPGSL